MERFGFVAFGLNGLAGPSVPWLVLPTWRIAGSWMSCAGKPFRDTQRIIGGMSYGGVGSASLPSKVGGFGICLEMNGGPFIL